MCGIAGFMTADGAPAPTPVLNSLLKALAHRGPDGEGTWEAADGSLGLAHRRLAIIDLSDAAAQPMRGENGTHIVYNGEIYNHVELREALKPHWHFRTRSDTEVILAAYAQYGTRCLEHLRGMFAFALWDPQRRRLFCARDRFGIKPFYFAETPAEFLFASEAKAMLPFLEIATDPGALAEYLTFQYTIGEHTLFRGIRQLLPGHALTVEDGRLSVWRYWDVAYDIDYEHSPRYFQERLRELLEDSVRLHLRSDVPVGAYLSGGIDSSLIAILAGKTGNGVHEYFHGRFTEFPGYDESNYAAVAAAHTRVARLRDRT